MNYLSKLLLCLLLLCLSVPAYAQKVESEKEIVVKVVEGKKSQELGDLDDIDPNDIESVEVLKNEGQKMIKILLKNGDVIERTLNGADNTVKTMIIKSHNDSGAKNMVFTTTMDDSDIKELFPEVKEEDIESIDISIENEKKVVSIVTKSGKKHSKEVASDANTIVTGHAVSNIKWVSEDKERLD